MWWPQQNALPVCDMTRRLGILPLLVLLAGLLVLVVGSDRVGLVLCGVSGLTAGVLRLTQQPESIGWLVSRRKPVDIAASVILGAALCVVALALPH